MTQEQLAERLGLHRAYISTIERGGRNVSLRVVGQLAEALGVAARELFDDP